ncbi:MAG: DNA-3-methyladenine glycosylase [Bacteroidales bacterium]|nr:DNA-3-methyladenine glycosylase [Bacteroidales bacterium]
MPVRPERSFFEQDATVVAQELIGKMLFRKTASGTASYIITEVEAYMGEEDQASHARFGKTTRNAIMYAGGGHVYVYLIYGMYWMLNIVTGRVNDPQAVLIRGVTGYEGPGKVGRLLSIDKSFYGEDLVKSSRLWLAHSNHQTAFVQTPRVGIDYAGEFWKSKPWRYLMVQPPQNF